MKYVMEGFQQERRDFLRLLGIGGMTALVGGTGLPSVWAQEAYPSERISWIVPVKAGGGFDLIARTIAMNLGKQFKAASKGSKGGDVVTKNMAEAGGAKAYSTIFHAKPDGYTIGDFNTAFITDNITGKPDFDCTKYTFLLLTGSSVRLIVSNKRNGFKSWEEMVKASRDKEIKMAASNFGRGYHVACILLKEATKIPMKLVNFPGAAENANALLRGDVNVAMLTEESSRAMIEAGEFRVLAVLDERSDYPGVPSIAQLGYPDLAEPTKLQRFVIGAPNLPKEVKDALVANFKKVFADRECLAQLKKLEFSPAPLYGADAEKLAKKLFNYYDEYTPLLKKYLL